MEKKIIEEIDNLIKYYRNMESELNDNGIIV